MPRGFLVKRTKNAAAFSYRVRNSDDSDSDHEHIQTNFGSPDSGYSPSPISLTPRERDLHAFDRDPTQGTTLPSSPLPSYPSPHYFYAFDRLSVSNCSPVNLTPVKNETGTAALSSPNKRRGPAEAEKKVKTPKKPKACRKINFDEDKTSPVSGTIIKDISDTDEEGQVVCGDIDSAFNYVEITAEAKAELEKIENKIGDYVCQLCKEYFDDAFQLARHRCSRIVHVEYRCPECDKVFNCPANLASHRRWHKPKTASDKKNVPTHILPASIPSVALNSNHSNGTNGDPMDESSDKCDSPRMLTSPPGSPNNYTASTHHHQFFNSNSSPSPSSASPPAVTINDCPSSTVEEGQFQCEICFKRFRRQAYLKKHILNHNNDRAKQQQQQQPPEQQQQQQQSEQHLSLQQQQQQQSETSQPSTHNHLQNQPTDSPPHSYFQHKHQLHQHNNQNLTQNNGSSNNNNNNNNNSSNSSNNNNNDTDSNGNKEPTSSLNSNVNTQNGASSNNSSSMEVNECSSESMATTTSCSTPAATNDTITNATSIASNGSNSSLTTTASTTTTTTTTTTTNTNTTTTGNSNNNNNSNNSSSNGNGTTAHLSCDHCNSIFTTKTALEKHSRTHSGEVFTCKYCSSRFYSSPGLTRHINKCHPSENRQVILLQLTPVNRPC
eukprot:XP_014779213.1 PREDICTED: insulinoma-associated protein 1a-like [Octopus bimaculoides]